MSNPTAETVTVALDVHKRSLRLAALRADELLDERTLPYDHAAVERAISRWPGARVCYPGPARGQCRLALPAIVSSRYSMCESRCETSSAWWAEKRPSSASCSA